MPPAFPPGLRVEGLQNLSGDYVRGAEINGRPSYAAADGGDVVLCWASPAWLLSPRALCETSTGENLGYTLPSSPNGSASVHALLWDSARRGHPPSSVVPQQWYLPNGAGGSTSDGYSPTDAVRLVPLASAPASEGDGGGAAIAGAVGAVLAVGALLAVLLLRRRRALQRRTALPNLCSNPVYDVEQVRAVRREAVNLVERLGKGNFGDVWKALLDERAVRCRPIPTPRAPLLTPRRRRLEDRPHTSSPPRPWWQKPRLRRQRRWCTRRR